MDEILQIKDLTKKYGDFKLDQVSFSIPNPDKPEKHNTKILPVRLLIRSRIFIAINCIKM